MTVYELNVCRAPAGEGAGEREQPGSGVILVQIEGELVHLQNDFFDEVLKEGLTTHRPERKS